MAGWARGLSDRRWQGIALVAVLAVLAAGIGWAVWHGGGGRKVTAYFTNASALFENNDVRVLGVPVGTVDTITPEGTRVRVDMTITDPDVRLPADARAAIVSPSLVTGRYVQLFPVLTGDGPQLADGATIPLERTAVPLGVDDLARTATELSRALGPDGANRTGAVSDALNVGAANLAGNGQALNDTVRNLGDLSGTLAGSADDLFGTVTELQKFTSTLAANDAQVRELNGRLADVTGFLAGQRKDLGAALSELSVALGEVAAFVRDNRAALHDDVEGLTRVTGVLVEQQHALTEILDVAPLGISNLGNTYNASAGTLDTRANINELTRPPLYFLCDLLHDGTPDQLAALKDLASACSALPQADALPSPAEVVTALQRGAAAPVPGLAVPNAPDPAARGGGR